MSTFAGILPQIGVVQLLKHRKRIYSFSRKSSSMENILLRNRSFFSTNGKIAPLYLLRHFFVMQGKIEEQMEYTNLKIF